MDTHPSDPLAMLTCWRSNSGFSVWAFWIFIEIILQSNSFKTKPKPKSCSLSLRCLETEQQLPQKMHIREKVTSGLILVLCMLKSTHSSIRLSTTLYSVITACSTPTKKGLFQSLSVEFACWRCSCGEMELLVPHGKCCPPLLVLLLGRGVLAQESSQGFLAPKQETLTSSCSEISCYLYFKQSFANQSSYANKRNLCWMGNSGLRSDFHFYSVSRSCLPRRRGLFCILMKGLIQLTKLNKRTPGCCLWCC